MAPEPQPANKEIIKISGKEITRKGIEAFVFIHLDGWGVSRPAICQDYPLELIMMDRINAIQNLPISVFLNERNALFRAIMNNVWKWLTAGGQQISKITTCMECPDWATGSQIDWKAPVDFAFDCFQREEFEAWSKGLILCDPVLTMQDQLLTCQTTWDAAACVPRTKSIIVVAVTDNDVNRADMLERFKDRTNILAFHQLDYPDYLGVTRIIQEIYSRDPDGTIEVQKSMSKIPNAASVCQDD